MAFAAATFAVAVFAAATFAVAVFATVAFGVAVFVAVAFVGSGSLDFPPALEVLCGDGDFACAFVPVGG
ncbi:MAG TPA: hypothetical protein VMR25_27195 [Planctomycetaceae bacterium]|nr:hypothetical protein [Planctomycetaceae bacterium]